MLVDLETLLRPQLIDANANSENICQGAAEQSVLTVGLLPSPVRMEDRLVDMSGLGARPDQPTPLQTMGFDAGGTDAMRVTRVQFSVGTSSHLPRLSGQFQMVTAYIEPLVVGFRDAYRLMMSCASELSSAIGPISAFGDCDIRVLLRPTATYASLLQESYHPRALTDGAEYDLVMAQIWSRVMSRPIWQQSVIHEFTELQRGDIPFFACCASGTTLISGSGHQLESVLSMSGIDAVRTRIARMSDADLCLQEWIIQASIACLGEPNTHSTATQRLWSRGTSIAEKAVYALLSTSVRAGTCASWLTLTPTTTGHADPPLDYQITEVGVDLYDGLAGIAFFLFAFAAQTREEGALHLARGALNELDRRVGKSSDPQPIGAYTGLSGVIYTYARLPSGSQTRVPN